MKLMLFFTYLFGLSFCLNVQAHQLRPDIIDIVLNKEGLVNINIQTNLERVMAGIGKEHEDTDDAPEAQLYNQLRKYDEKQLEKQFMEFAKTWLPQLQLNFDQQSQQLSLQSVVINKEDNLKLPRLSIVSLSAPLKVGMKDVSWQYPEQYGDYILHYYYLDNPSEKTSHWVTQQTEIPSFQLNQAYVPKSMLEIAWEYIVLGYEHIIPKGLDHILFVLGLFLLSAKLKPLLWQITAFTLAHSITLGLTVFQVISLSPSIIEPLIAISIIYVGIENLMTQTLKTWRIVIVFLFGLLHGMGFAGVLSDLGLPESDFVSALLFFNVGVELGQLTVILVSLVAVYFLMKDPIRYRKYVVIPFSLMISLVGVYWTIERVFL